MIFSNNIIYDLTIRENNFLGLKFIKLVAKLNYIA
jgi:hypothetical protein